jgi:hypothetical protein
MKAEKAAEGVLKRNDWGDTKMYNVPCQCGCEHHHDVWVEADELGIVSVTTYVQEKTKWWELNRFQKIWRLLTRGYIEYEASIIMSQQQALNYAETLKSAVKDVEQFRKQKNA